MTASALPATAHQGPAVAVASATDAPLRIGPLTLRNRLLLAPMAGITDRPFRILCRRLGAGLAVAEMCSADPSLRYTRKSRERAEHQGEPGPIAIQLLGADPARMAAAARYHADHGADLIDINIGCPARKVCRGAAGSALLRDELLLGHILEAVVGAVQVPVTLKTRTGWSPTTRNLLRVGAIARDAGIAMITVHGRTRACGYDRPAEHESLRELRGLLNLPLVANGDIDSPARARAVLDAPWADAVMIGRAALGQPWLFSDIDRFLRDGETPVAPTREAIGALLLEHLDALYHLYGESRGVRVARKHILWYWNRLGQSECHPAAPGVASCPLSAGDASADALGATASDLSGTPERDHPQGGQPLAPVPCHAGSGMGTLAKQLRSQVVRAETAQQQLALVRAAFATPAQQEEAA